MRREPDKGAARPILRLAEEFAAVSSVGRPLRICVVTSEILGPVKNGGIGTATSGLVEHLLSDGHQVTVLFTSVEYGIPMCHERDWSYWVATLARRNVELAHIPHEGDYRMWRCKSWLVKEFLAERDFDAVCFNEHHGSGYYALAAKRAGLPSFARRVHCVITHGSLEWVFNTNDQFISRPSDLEMMGLERRSVEWADVVIGPSEYLLREYEKYGWRLPKRTYVQPYPFQFHEVGPSTDLVEVSELVFFGRLEPRKGLWLFCEAIEQLAERLRGQVVTFMGRITDVGEIPSAALIIERSARWPFRIRLLTDLNQSEALDYLREPGRLAVMPSLADNSPCVIYECMSSCIPFVTTSGSGADELVHPDCWNRVMVEPSVRALSQRLDDILDHGAGRAWPRFDAESNLKAWSAWVDWLGSRPDEADAAASRDEPLSPLVAQRMLLVTIDCADCSLGGLADRIALHRQRFGPSMQHMILTSRLGRARELLEEALRAGTSKTLGEVRILGTEAIGSALEAIGSADLVFFTDAKHEVLSTFFVSALAALVQRGASAVSCVAAERRGSHGSLTLTELPCGDLPAAGGLGLPIGSNVWGAVTKDIRGVLTEEAFYRAEAGDLVESVDLGQVVLHRLIGFNKEVLLVPSVGAVRRREPTVFPQRRHWYRMATEIAQSLGIEPFVYPGATVWLGLNEARRAVSSESKPAVELELRSGHPLNVIHDTGHSISDLARFSAALGRPDQAVRLQAGWDSDLHTAASLLDVAKRATEAREQIDLLSILLGQSLKTSRPTSSSQDSLAELTRYDFRDRLMAAIARQKVVDKRELPEAHFIFTNESPDGPDFEKELTDRPLLEQTLGAARALSDVFEVHQATDFKRISLRGSSFARSGRLTFIDVLLAGHQGIVADLTLEKHLPVAITLNVIDQATGGVIAEVEIQVLHQGSARLALDLHGVFGAVCVSLSFETRNGALRTPLNFDLNRFMID